MRLLKSHCNLAFIHFEVQRIADPEEVERDPEKYLRDLRDVLLHMDYEYPRWVQHHIFWIGITESGQMRIGICCESNGQKEFSLMSDFIQAVIDRGEETNWLGKKTADERKKAKSQCYFDKLEPRYYRLDPEFNWVRFGGQLWMPTLPRFGDPNRAAFLEDTYRRLRERLMAEVSSPGNRPGDETHCTMSEADYYIFVADIFENGLGEQELLVQFGLDTLSSARGHLKFGPCSVTMSVSQFRSMNAEPVESWKIADIFGHELRWD